MTEWEVGAFYSSSAEISFLSNDNMIVDHKGGDDALVEINKLYIPFEKSFLS